jgi:hypothetical protein
MQTNISENIEKKVSPQKIQNSKIENVAGSI